MIYPKALLIKSLHTGVAAYNTALLQSLNYIMIMRCESNSCFPCAEVIVYISDPWILTIGAGFGMNHLVIGV
jgi:hypothetical protein